MALLPVGVLPPPLFQCQREGCPAVCDASTLLHVTQGKVFLGYFCRDCVKELHGELVLIALRDVPQYKAIAAEQIR